MSAWTGAFLGLAGGLGLALTLRGIPIARRPESGRPGRPLPRRRAPRRAGSVPHLPTAVPPPHACRRAPSRMLERVLGGRASVERRLVQAAREPQVERFRLEQLAWGAAGLAVALALSLAAAGRRLGPATAGVARALRCVDRDGRPRPRPRAQLVRSPAARRG